MIDSTRRNIFDFDGKYTNNEFCANGKYKQHSK